MSLKSLTPLFPNNQHHQDKADYLIIGKGLFGSAAAYHLGQTGQDVLLVGSDEPANWTAHKGVFSSHYDEGRVVSQSAPDPVLEQLDLESIAEYDTIERESGVPFFVPTGRLTASPSHMPARYPYAAPEEKWCRPFCTQSHGSPYRFPQNYITVFEEAPSGYLNPRAMVKAQIKAAKKRGVGVMSGLVIHIEPGDQAATVSLSDGRQLIADKVLIATGAFTNCFGLMPEKIAIRAEASTTVLCEVTDETALQLMGLPPLNFLHTNSPLTHITLLPPLRYADGKQYIKLAVSSTLDTRLPDKEAMTNWFSTCSSFAYMDEVKEMMASLIPSVRILSWTVKPCIITYTPTGKPMIDCLVDNQVYIAVGGNGGSAHTSNAIGRLAADLMTYNRWVSPLDHTPFQFQRAVDWREWIEETNPTTPW